MPSIDSMIVTVIGGFLMYGVLIRAVPLIHMVMPTRMIERVFMLIVGTLFWVTFIFPAGFYAGSQYWHTSQDDLLFYTAIFLAYGLGVFIAHMIFRRNDG